MQQTLTMDGNKSKADWLREMWTVVAAPFYGIHFTERTISLQIPDITHHQLEAKYPFAANIPVISINYIFVLFIKNYDA